MKIKLIILTLIVVTSSGCAHFTKYDYDKDGNVSSKLDYDGWFQSNVTVNSLNQTTKMTR